MSKKKKRIIIISSIISALLIALAVVLCIIFIGEDEPTSPQVSERESLLYGDFEYRVLDNDKIEITKYHGKSDSIAVPSVINSKAVAYIPKIPRQISFCRGIFYAKFPSSIYSASRSLA